ncbi:hypothetical protein CBR_g51932 [Chara braunii]|uniref:Reverse transcriptase RNase H-like domain-containing protein n=1 Tax=Chara braunii TaxID=69332 RepID=A0A388M9A1_CHABU|nr:hypothetical protein CBR_g51932 [Chara braunii]|eukprot:GBG91130.1 hypothetical protein CBR_g51932 [Chara braunii]
MTNNNDNQDERRNNIRELARIIQQSQKDKIPKVDVPLFDGNNASGWAEKFEQLGSCCEWSNEKMLRMVKRYCKIQYKEEVEELVQDSLDWPEFKRKLLDKYQLSDQLLDLTDLRKVSRKSFGTTKQFLTEFERVARLVPNVPDKDRCLIFLDNFTEVEQLELVKGMKERYDWSKIRENLLAGNFDQILYRSLKQQKENRERIQLGTDKDREVYKTLSDMKEMMTSMKEERLKLQVMMAKAKTGKRKEKQPINEESSSESESEEERKPPRKLTKAERKALNQIRGGQCTSHKQGESSKNGGNGSGERQVDQGQQNQGQQTQPQGGRGRDRGRGNGGGRGNWQEYVCKYCDMKGHIIHFCQILAKDEKDHIVFTTIRGEVFDFEGNLIDQDIEGGMRKEVFRRMKTNEILEWPTPFRSITDVRSFLGTCGFWRVFIRRFAARVEHLWKLVRKNQVWEWGPKQQSAVEDIKAEFREGGLILGVPCFYDTEGRPFIIETDAGPTALGGVFVQKDGEGRERPLRFESRTLNITERKYSQFKKETLAVLHCLRIFRNYIFGKRFILRVDPTALAQSLKKYSPSDPTTARWLTYIWMFNFEIERISGAQNRADGLSRVDWYSSTDQAEDSVPVDGFLEGKESQLSINSYNYLADATTRNGKTIWNAPCFHHVRSEFVIGESFIEEDPWGERTSEQMMNLALSDEVELIKEPLTIEYGHEQADKTFRITGEISFLVNSLIHEDCLKMMNEEAEGDGIREAFREGEYDGEYKLMGMWLNGELREDEVDPDVRQKSKDFVVRYGHIFKKSNDDIPRRVVCGVTRQLDVIAALHDGVAGGHRSARVTLKKIQHLYFWEGMNKMVNDLCNSCLPC